MSTTLCVSFAACSAGGAAPARRPTVVTCAHAGLASSWSTSALPANRQHRVGRHMLCLCFVLMLFQLIAGQIEVSTGGAASADRPIHACRWFSVWQCWRAIRHAARQAARALHTYCAGRSNHHRTQACSSLCQRAFCADRRSARHCNKYSLLAVDCKKEAQEGALARLPTVARSHRCTLRSGLTPSSLQEVHRRWSEPETTPTPQVLLP